MADFRTAYETLSETDFLEFDRVPPERRLSNRPDLCAFMLLDRLVPGNRDLIGCAEHDEFWISVDVDDLDAAVTDAGAALAQAMEVQP